MGTYHSVTITFESNIDEDHDTIRQLAQEHCERLELEKGGGYSLRGAKDYLRVIATDYYTMYSGTCGREPLVWGTGIKNFVDKEFLTALKPFFEALLKLDHDASPGVDGCIYILHLDDDHRPDMWRAKLDNPDSIRAELIYERIGLKHVNDDDVFGSIVSSDDNNVF